MFSRGARSWFASFSSHQEVCPVLALRSLKKNGIWIHFKIAYRSQKERPGNEEWTTAWISWWLRLKGKGTLVCRDVAATRKSGLILGVLKCSVKAGGLAWIKRLFVALIYTWLVCLHFFVLVRFFPLRIKVLTCIWMSQLR